MPKGRPGGNPDLGTKYALTTDRPEALTERITVRIPPKMKKKRKQLNDYPEFIREAIEEKLKKIESEEQFTKIS
jgi:glycyl-tRNA synthetase (class II)